MIAFPHDAQQTMAARLPSIENLHTAIQIHFIGTELQMEAMKSADKFQLISICIIFIEGKSYMTYHIMNGAL